MLTLTVSNIVVVIRHTGHHVLQLKRIAPVEWQIDDSFFIDNVADGCIRQVDRRRCTADLDSLTDCANNKRDRYGDILVDLKNDSLLFKRTEPVLGYSNCVVAHRQDWKTEFTRVATRGGSGFVCSFVDDGNARAGHGCACVVCDCSDNFTSRTGCASRG